MTSAVAVSTTEVLVLVSNGELDNVEKITTLIGERVQKSPLIDGDIELQVMGVEEDLSLEDQKDFAKLIEQSFKGVYLSTSINLPYLVGRLSFMYGSHMGSDGLIERPLFALMDMQSNEVLSIGNTDIF